VTPGRWGLLAALPALPAVICGGVTGFAGYVLGAGGAALNLWAWWLLLGTLGRAIAETRNPRGATSVVVLAFLLKAPLLIALAFGARRIGGAAVPWCMAGVVLVYFLLVGWCLNRSQADRA
jgi:hypothetical protein